MELNEMKKELSSILNSNRMLRQAMKEVNKMDMIKASLVVRNPMHQKLHIDRILEGELDRNVPVGDYVFIQNFCELVKVGYNNLDMGNFMDRRLLTVAYQVLSENPAGGLRRDNPIVYAFSHVPPHCSDLDEKLSTAFRKVYYGGIEKDVVKRAMFMHNSIIELWPFDEYNGELAVFAMNYYLLEQGLMPIDMPINRQDYLNLINDSLKGRRQSDLYDFFRNAIFAKMIQTMEACRGYAK